jgi:O-acetyl-ADP-ribose deacetylase (regulator of RNase III)
MIEYIKKDITTVDRGIVGHGVNCSGYAYKSGVAGAVRKKWPIAFESYKKLGGGKDLLGTAHSITINNDLHVVNMYTQVNFGYGGEKYADCDAIAKTLEVVVSLADEYQLPVYVPKIGCGLGGLDYDYEVESIYEYVAGLYPDVEIFVCEL